jgi:hypothetical protein
MSNDIFSDENVLNLLRRADAIQTTDQTIEIENNQESIPKELSAVEIHTMLDTNICKIGEFNSQNDYLAFAENMYDKLDNNTIYGVRGTWEISIAVENTLIKKIYIHRNGPPPIYGWENTNIEIKTKLPKICIISKTLNSETIVKNGKYSSSAILSQQVFGLIIYLSRKGKIVVAKRYAIKDGQKYLIGIRLHCKQY